MDAVNKLSTSSVSSWRTSDLTFVQRVLGFSLFIDVLENVDIVRLSEERAIHHTLDQPTTWIPEWYPSIKDYFTN